MKSESYNTRFFSQNFKVGTYLCIPLITSNRSKYTIIQLNDLLDKELLKQL